MASRFWLVCFVFGLKNGYRHCKQQIDALSGAGVFIVRQIQRWGGTRLLLAGAWLLCRLRLTGKRYRRLSAVATQNYQSLVLFNGRIDVDWISLRRLILEQAATWGRDKKTLAQMAACSRQLDAAIAPLRTEQMPVILAPLHMVSDTIAAIIGAGVQPGRASVVVSASAGKFDDRDRKCGGIALDYCYIDQTSSRLASQLKSIIIDVKAGEQNLIVFPDITPDYTAHGSGNETDKLSCHLFGLPAKLHNGVIRLASVIGARIVFYRLHYRHGITLDILPPMTAAEAKSRLPEIIESTLREYPDDWLLWHSHSLYFINQ